MCSSHLPQESPAADVSTWNAGPEANTYTDGMHPVERNIPLASQRRDGMVMPQGVAGISISHPSIHFEHNRNVQNSQRKASMQVSDIYVEQSSSQLEGKTTAPPTPSESQEARNHIDTVRGSIEGGAGNVGKDPSVGDVSQVKQDNSIIAGVPKARDGGRKRRRDSSFYAPYLK